MCTKRSRNAVVAGVLALLLVGCPGYIEEPGLFTGEVTCEMLIDYYISRSCVAGCHSAAYADAELDLETPPVGPRLVGKRAHETGCDGVLVNPDDPEASIMYRKLLPTPPCGSRMPMFDSPPRQRHLDCFLEWIAAQEKP